MSSRISARGPFENLLHVPFIYGTAWKKGRSSSLVEAAITAGFRCVDTAAQPKHYQEDLVGKGIRECIKKGVCTRQELYIQTKFTSTNGQDPRSMPYDPTSPLETQIHSSIASSLANLRHSEQDSNDTPGPRPYIDCLLLHSPIKDIETTLRAWKAFETFVPNSIRSLGISNVSLPMLEAICEKSSVKPAAVQNRFYSSTNYDAGLREFCQKNDILYESFWTLTANPQLLAHSSVTSLSRAASVSKEVALYSLVMALEIVVLNGTTSPERMREDLDGIRQVQQWVKEKPDMWTGLLRDFNGVVERAVTSRYL